MGLDKDTLFASFESSADFALQEEDSQINPSFHMGTTRIFAIESVANNVQFSQESTINALPTLKNIPIVALYKENENNFGDHEIIQDSNGISYGTYPIGMIPESAEQWIEEVQTDEGIKQYLCSDVLLWKRQKKEFQLIKTQRNFSVSMEVGMVDYDFSSNNVCIVNKFYFTAIAVLGNGVRPAFDDACINFSKIGTFQDMMLEFKEYTKQLGGNSMGENLTKNFEDNQEPQNVQSEPQQQEPQNTEPSNGEQGKQEPENQEPQTDYKVMLEKAEAEYGRTIAELTKERDDLNAKLLAQEEDKKAIDEAHQVEMDALKEELDALRKYKKEVEDKQRKDAREGIINQMANDFPELSESEEYKKLLENEELSAEDLEDKVYAIVGKLEREKRGSKRRQVPQQVNRVPIANPKSSNKDKRNNSPYGGLLIK